MTAGYGIAYPLAVIVAVLFVQLLPKFMRKDVAEEEVEWIAEQKKLHPTLEFRQFRVENMNCIGKSVRDIGRLYMTLVVIKTLASMAALAAGMTQPSALEVTKQRAKTELPLIAYASVYPFAMILKIVLVQVLVIIASTM